MEQAAFEGAIKFLTKPKVYDVLEHACTRDENMIAICIR